MTVRPDAGAAATPQPQAPLPPEQREAPRVRVHIPPATAIRDAPPKARRLSRKMLLAGALLVGGLFAIALVAGLSDRPDRHARADDGDIVTQPSPPDSVRAAPASYDGMALGGTAEAYDVGLNAPRDRLWGDHGPPPDMAPDTGDRSAGAGPSLASRAPSPAEEAAAAARSSPILFEAQGAASPAVSAARGAFAGRHGGFLAAQGQSESVLEARLTAPAARFLIQAGATIPAALLTALNSDLPGRVIAQVSENVFDSQTGDQLLVPQGARLIGAYQSDIVYGERRILVAWNRLILPNGSSIDLAGMEATDAGGAAGLRARADNHLGRLALASVLSGALAVGANEVEDRAGGGLSPSVGDAAAQEATRVGGRIVERDLDVRPTLRVDAGARVRVLVSRDIVLKPYRP